MNSVRMERASKGRARALTRRLEWNGGVALER